MSNSEKEGQDPQGFIKTTEDASSELSSEQKAILNRRGNELFNAGDIEAAKRIFMTTGYSDGLTRIGDYYNKENRSIDALKMYWMARNMRQAEPIIKDISSVISAILEEDENGE